MSEDTSDKAAEENVSPRTWVEFLQEHPPGAIVRVTGASESSERSNALYVALPELQLYCPRDTCNAYMFFASDSYAPDLEQNQRRLVYLTYLCRNCQKYSKTFSVAVLMLAPDLAEVYKFGEFPHFGPPVPPRVLRLIQPDREFFLSGRRCENQGLGIGAFAYYRRVVENQWRRLIDEILRVAKGSGAPAATVSALEEARNEQQFSKAVKCIKDAIPSALLINGHNPLVLLHAALSQGVHDLPDKDCLSLATSIRAVLVELAEKLGQALKDDRELDEAVKRLLQAKSDKTKKEEANS